METLFKWNWENSIESHMHGNVDSSNNEKSEFGQRFLMLTSVIIIVIVGRSIDMHISFSIFTPRFVSPRVHEMQKLNQTAAMTMTKQSKTKHSQKKKIWNKFKMNECALLRYHFLLIQQIANSWFFCHVEKSHTHTHTVACSSARCCVHNIYE